MKVIDSGSAGKTKSTKTKQVVRRRRRHLVRNTQTLSFPVRWSLLRYSVKSDLSSQETQKSADGRRKSPLAGLGLPHVMGVHAKT